MTDDSRSVPPPQEAGFHKANWPFYWITQTSNRYMQVMERRLKTIGMDVAYWRVLMSLYEDQALSISEISSYCIIKPNTATKIIQRMTAQGLVTTGPRPSDGRVTEVCLTPAGHEMRRNARSIADEVFVTAFEDLSREEQMVLNLLLEKVYRKLE
ncbi:MarR family winged helix-turn-helix transcriptional regulator [Pseudooceanicola marinus]|uniref:MarR family winged helix-turn-helix transcriptional regulator n=1 Tax=Pseudooceanicola marinus TaxID=396013 RepID=UPI001C956F30|nr:MarR family winged helix-turn-helix transcriptional regulator [Pseudooceanicola marinus]MBY5973669.1 MarR family winged helix-turn-helix transcriptional regulator [Ferrimonas balearica]MCA1338236.1 MarR family winged helix-turn-helix transcriptional regulator [Pseudooceanicola marinus]